MSKKEANKDLIYFIAYLDKFYFLLDPQLMYLQNSALHNYVVKNIVNLHAGFWILLFIAMFSPVKADDVATFQVGLSKPVKFNLFTLKNPHRIVLDLPQTELYFPKNKPKKDGLVRAFRYGNIGQNKTRIIVETVEQVKVTKAYVLRPEFSQPARLVVELKKEIENSGVEGEEKSQTKLSGVSLPVPNPRNIVKRLARLEPQNKSSQENKTVIVIDPGHGGDDKGAVGRKGTLEKKIVLKFAKILAKKLASTGRFKVLMTRSDDSFIELPDRVKFALENKGNLFLSIHADSVPKKRRRRVRGATIYTLDDQGSDELSRLVAEEANKSPFFDGWGKKKYESKAVNILQDLTQRETNRFSVDFANRYLLKTMKKRIRLNKKPLRSANFHVLRNAEIPSVLLELGFLSNRRDEKLMQSTSWQKKAASAIATAVSNYFKVSAYRKPF